MILDNYDKKALQRLLSYCRRNENGCLIFTGSLDNNGYGKIKYKNKDIRCHRLIMHLKQDFDLSSGLLILHKNFICKSKACIEEEHLYVGTDKENHSDAIEMGLKPFGKEKQTHCGICGLELAGNNLKESRQGKKCRNCDKRRKKEAYQRNKLEISKSKID